MEVVQVRDRLSPLLQRLLHVVEASWRSIRDCRVKELSRVLVEIDGREVRTEDDLHRLLDRALDFGPYYGSNLDALWDRLSRDVPRPVRVVWTHWRVSRRNLGAQRFEKICDLLCVVQAEDQEFGYDERFEFELR